MMVKFSAASRQQRLDVSCIMLAFRWALTGRRLFWRYAMRCSHTLLMSTLPTAEISRRWPPRRYRSSSCHKGSARAERLSINAALHASHFRNALTSKRLKLTSTVNVSLIVN